MSVPPFMDVKFAGHEFEGVRTATFHMQIAAQLYLAARNAMIK